MIANLWTDTENVYENNLAWEQLLFLEFSDSHLMMDEEDTKFFNELPNTLASLGIGLTVAAGLYAILREHTAAKEAALAASGAPRAKAPV